MKNTAIKFSCLAISMLLIHGISAIGNPANAQDAAYKKREAAVEQNMKFARRLKNIASPVRVKLASACGKMVTPFIGAEFATTDSVGENYQAVMQNLYNTGMYPTITMIANKSPAAKSLQIGDMVTHVNGVALTKGSASLGEIKDHIRASKNAPIKLSIDREGAAKSITLTPVSACDKPARLVNQKGKEVFVDDTKIGVTKGVLKSNKDDKEIAAEIEKELMESLS